MLGDKENDDLNSTDVDGGRTSQYKGSNLIYSWLGECHQARSFSSAALENIMKAFKPYLLAVLYSGSAGGEATVWPDQKMFLNQIIKREWVNMASKIGKLEGIKDENVETQPSEAERRKVNVALFCGCS